MTFRARLLGSTTYTAPHDFRLEYILWWYRRELVATMARANAPRPGLGG